jgi:hypothetical protein
MPETTVHEHNDLMLPKNKIGFPKYALVAPPARNAVRLEKRHQFQFRVLIS